MDAFFSNLVNQKEIQMSKELERLQKELQVVVIHHVVKQKH